MIQILLIAFALSFDAFAVSVSGGLTAAHTRFSYSIRAACFFGIFQGFMPIIGWTAGISFRSLISHFDHWIAFVILAIIGGRMIYEAFSTKKNRKKLNILDIKMLLILSIATSIDALAAGLSFAFMNVSILKASLIIGIVTFIICSIGGWLGRKATKFNPKIVEFIGGLILIGVGSNILISHLF